MTKKPDKQLVLSGLSITFRSEGKDHQAIESVSFALRKGASLGIVGESGSGKSVTSLAIMGLLPSPAARISGGSIHLYDDSGKHLSLLDLSAKMMRSIRGKRIAMIFQEPMTALNPAYRCGRQVAENILQHEKISRKAAKQRTLDLFREVMLPRPEEMYRAFPHQLSGGQKQRIMIAMAISCNPEILIADEPTTALDVTVQKAILELLKQLKAKHNMSLIFISHDLGVISEVAEDVVVMYQGNIVESGPVEKVFREPEHPYTKGLLACRPPLNTRPGRLPVIANFLHPIPGKPAMIQHSDRKSAHLKIYSGDPLLRTDHLRTQFITRRNILGKITSVVQAVDDISFKVYPGETFGLVGESGCGKTTLGRTLLRLIEPTSGRIFYGKEEINKLSSTELRKLRKKMQIIFQDPYSSLNPRITAGSSIMEPMNVHGLHGNERTRKFQAYELLEKVGLDISHFYRYPHEFSGGQRQRICIARALAVEPEFIICDESVSALDVSVQAQILNLLNDLKEEYGLTYVFISHDLSVVRYMSDRLMVMKNGQIVETGEADRVYSNPESAYTRMLIDSIPKGI